MSHWLNTRVINHMTTSVLKVPLESSDKCVLMSTVTFTHTGLSDNHSLWSHGGSIILLIHSVYLHFHWIFHLYFGAAAAEILT